MRRLLVHLLVFSLTFGFPTLVSADDFQWIWQKGEKKWLPQLELSGRPGNNDLYGMEIDPIIPIAQNENSLFYLNVRNSLFWEDGDFSHEFNAGGGYRRIMGDDSWILGGYGFFDRLESRYDNHFNQGTLGVEGLAWDWDARINGYIASSTSKSAPGAGGPKVSLSGTSLSMKTMQEQALSGIDGEIGYRLPFFGDDGVFSDMRIFAGGFFFDNDEVDSIAGPSARFEARIWEVPFLPAESRVTLGANYRWDSVRHSQVEGVVALRVPIGRVDRSKPLTHLERRMTDRVVRDVNIVTNTGLSNEEAVLTRTGVEVEDVYFFSEQGMSDGSFEDPFTLAEAVATGENNLLIGLARGGDVYSVDTQLLDGQTVLGGGMPLYVWGKDSGEKAVWVAPGQAATLTGFGENEAAFLLANNNTIAGLFFQGGEEEEARPADGGGGAGFPNGGYALELNLDGPPTMADIYNNHFSQLEHAIEVDVASGSGLQMWIWDNFFERMENGLDVYAPGSFDLSFDVYDNEFANLGNGLDFALFPNGDGGASSFALNATDNIFSDNDAGISTYVRYSGSEDYTHNSYVGDNTFFRSRYDDYEVTLEGEDPDGEIHAMIEVENNVSLNGDTFADIEVGEDGPFLPIMNGQVDIWVHGNEVVGTEEGIIIEVNDGPDITAMIDHNEITDTNDENGSGDAIYVGIRDSGDSAGHSITITDNKIDNSDGDGIDIEVYDSYDTVLTIADNEMTDVDNEGIEIDFENVGHDMGNSIVISDNSFAFQDDSDVIDIDVDHSYDTDITVTGNLIDDVDNADGIIIDVYDTGHDSGNMIVVSENTVLNAEDDGIDIYLNNLDSAGQTTLLTIADNTVSHTTNDDSDDNGIEVDLYEVDGATVTISGNTVEEADGGSPGDEGNGIRVEFEDSDDNTLTIAENEISRSGEHGIELDLKSDGGNGSDGNVIAINDNQITLADSNGIDIYVENGSTGNELGISGNEISYVDDGIQIDSFDGGTVLDSLEDNIVTYFLDDAADIDGTGTGEITVNGAQYGF